MIVTVTNKTAGVLSTALGSLAPGASKSVTMSAKDMYLAAAELQAQENLGYCSVAVLEETATNLNAQKLTGYPAREPQLDSATLSSPLPVLSNATATTSSPLQLTTSQVGALVNNGAASSEVGFVLPVSAPGMKFTFMCTAAAGIRIKGSGAEQIQITTSTSTATTGYVENTAAGSSLTLACAVAGKWMATSAEGTWTVV